MESNAVEAVVCDYYISMRKTRWNIWQIPISPTEDHYIIDQAIRKSLFCLSTSVYILRSVLLVHSGSLKFIST
jgi:hypothetical protein